MESLTSLDDVFSAVDTLLNEPVKSGMTLRDAGFLFNKAIAITRAVENFRKAQAIVNNTVSYR